jgi:hypothetical protein
MKKLRFISIFIVLVIIFSMSAACSQGKNSTTAKSSNSNLMNGGYIAQSGQWMYFTDPIARKFYKAKTDGTSKTELYDEMATGINIIGDWIYFTKASASTDDPDNGKLFKIKTDGTGLTRFIDESAFMPANDGTWIYYLSMPDMTDTFDFKQIELRRIKTDGTERMVVTKGAFGFNLENDWLYYINIADESGSMCKVKTDGTGQAKISDEAVQAMLVENGWIYFAPRSADSTNTKPKYFRMKTDGTARSEIGELGIRPFNVVGDWIFFSDNNKLNKIKTDGTGQTVVADVPAVYIYSFPDWIYYLSAEDGEGAFDQMKLHRIKADGTGQGTFGEGPSTTAVAATPTTALTADFKLGQSVPVGQLEFMVNYAFAPTNIGIQTNGGQGDIGGMAGQMLVIEVTIKNNGSEPVTIDGRFFSLLKPGVKYAFKASTGELHQSLLESAQPVLLPAKASATYKFSFSSDELKLTEKDMFFALQVTDGNSQTQPVKIGITPVIDSDRNQQSYLEEIRPAIEKKYSDLNARSFLTYWNVFEKDGAQYYLFETWQNDFTKSEYYYVKSGTAELYSAVQDPALPEFSLVPGKILK